MLDDQAKKAMAEVRLRAASLLDDLNLTDEEKQYATSIAKSISDSVAEQYLDDRILHERKVRPITAAAAVAFSLTYFDKWVIEVARKFPEFDE